jgi:two-component system, LuxR family, response regulator FixJ
MMGQNKPRRPYSGSLGRCGRTVHVIDDDEAVRRGIAMLLRSAGIGVETHPSGHAFLDALSGLGAGCALTDVRMPGLDGLELLRRLRDRGVQWPVVVMTAHGDIPTAVRAMKAGALDFIEKPFDDEDLLAVIEAAFTTAEVAGGAGRDDMAASQTAMRITALSPREREVLDLLLAGKTNKAIARNLGLSPRTVEVHRARMMARLGVDSFAEVVRLAVQAGLGRRSEDDGA